MRLFVGNLSFKTTERELEEAFGRFGSVTDSKVMTDRMTGRSRGFAFVTMGTKEEGDAAIKGLDGQALDGRPLRVNEATPREEGGGGGGGGRGGFNRGGGDRDRGDRGGDRGGRSYAGNNRW